MKKIKENRSFLCFLLLSVLTLGIYAVYHQYAMIRDINVMLKSDGKHTPQVYWVLLLFIPTLTLFPLFWQYELGKRLRLNLQARNLSCGIGGGGQFFLSLFGRQAIFLAWIAQYNLIRACNDLAVYYNKVAARKQQQPNAFFGEE